MICWHREPACTSCLHSRPFLMSFLPTSHRHWTPATLNWGIRSACRQFLKATAHLRFGERVGGRQFGRFVFHRRDVCLFRSRGRSFATIVQRSVFLVQFFHFMGVTLPHECRVGLGLLGTLKKTFALQNCSSLDTGRINENRGKKPIFLEHISRLGQ